uniref:ribonucleoside-diphosphate reductase n=1 Tax=viral metagenome TaxID=1070528 RepID=A0A6C0BXU8_9ZZZZ
MDDNEMYVTKRNNKVEVISFDKILKRVKNIGKKEQLNIKYSSLVMKVIDQLHDKIQTTKIDELTAEQCTMLSTTHPDYGKMAAHIVVSNHHKNTPNSFTEAVNKLHAFKDVRGIKHPLVSNKLWSVTRQHGQEINNMIDYERDFLIDYFGFKTLEKSYLMRVNGKIIERPQHMWMRVSIGIHGNHLEKVKETYELMSQKYFTHATPTLFNAGTRLEQLSSCYLLGMEDDSIDGIYNTLKDTALISKCAGGIGLHIHNIRGVGSHIKGTNGVSNGIVPMLKVFNNTARYVDQGGGRRNGSFAIYLEPWHIDIESFLDLKKNHGDEEQRCRDLFYGLWIPDLFMKRVHTDGEWLLCCPNECTELYEKYGEDFETLYEDYERRHREGQLQSGRIIKARDLWFRILDSQMETGTPYLLYKDAANIKSNQKNLGTIKSSNLCTEIIEYSDSEETAVCNLASIGLTQFVDNNNIFDYEKLTSVVKTITYNLNKIIDINYYPTEKTKRSNLLHRPIGIGVQGLADVFILMNVPFASPEAKIINKKIFETIYFSAVTESNRIAQERQENKYIKLFKEAYNAKLLHFRNDDPHCTEFDIDFNKLNNIMKKDWLAIFGESYIQSIGLPGSQWRIKKDLYKILGEDFITQAEFKNLDGTYEGAYSSFIGSPMSQGLFQFDLWAGEHTSPCGYDWNVLKEKITCYGMRNSLLVAPMPTASTSQILGNNECFEPLTSNIYSRRTGAGEFVMANKYLINELSNMGLWTPELKNNIIENKGSVQQCECIPAELREKYKIVWEISMKDVIEMAADRGKYICQSQSMNLWMEDPTYKTLTSMHFFAWNKGLKTGMYYLRRKAKHQAQQFTIVPTTNVEGDSGQTAGHSGQTAISGQTAGHSGQTAGHSANSGQTQEPDICEMCSS